MPIWTDHFPLQWIETTKFSSKDVMNTQNITLTAPLYSPFDSIQCDVVETTTIQRNRSPKDIPSHDEESIVCSCAMPADTAERMYTAANHHYLIAFGDSTIRNFIHFYHDIIRDAATMIPVSFLFPKTFQLQRFDRNIIPTNYYRAYCHISMRGGLMSQFVRDMMNFNSPRTDATRAKYVIPNPPACSSISSDNQPQSQSLLQSQTQLQSPLQSAPKLEEWVHDSYEVLGNPLINYTERARKQCQSDANKNGNTKNALIFVLSAGLHYIPVCFVVLLT
jgi:hypothetical protein